jgi:plasmid stabilization system protein ParE
MKIVVADQVKRYLISEKNYLKRQSARAHLAFARRFRDAARLLSAYPMAGAERPLPISGIRRLVVDDYVLDYEIVGNEIRILHMRHGRQSDPFLTVDEDFDFESDTDR